MALFVHYSYMNLKLENHVNSTDLVGEWVNEWNATNSTQLDYQDFGRAQLQVYDTASFGWAYWTLRNAELHWDLEWNIRNNYLQLSKKFLHQLLWY